MNGGYNDCMRVVALVGDPRLSSDYSADNLDERKAVRRLEEAVQQLANFELGVFDDHKNLLSGLSAREPDFVLNFCNVGFRNQSSLQMHVPALLDVLGLPYSGPPPEILALCHQKVAVSCLAKAAGVPVPVGDLVRVRDLHALPEHAYPRIAKPLGGSGSQGVEASSVLESARQARAYFEEVATLDPNANFVLEQYLPGREFTVGLIGNPGAELHRLPPIEVDYRELDQGKPHILTYASKADPNSPEYQQIKLRPADLTQAQYETLWNYARTMMEQLGCRDYVRLDFRYDAKGEPHLIDVNAQPIWYPTGMLATMAGYAGWSYAEFLKAILEATQDRLERSKKSR